MRISKYKNIFEKFCTHNWFEKVFVIKKVKNTVPLTHVIGNLKGEEIIGTFRQNEFRKTNTREFRIKKVIKRKNYRLYVKWKGYFFNSWKDKKDTIIQ